MKFLEEYQGYKIWHTGKKQRPYRCEVPNQQERYADHRTYVDCIRFIDLNRQESPNALDHFIQLWNEGESVSALAERYGFTAGTLNLFINALRHMGHDLKLRRPAPGQAIPVKSSPVTTDEFILLWQNKLTSHTIAKRLNVPLGIIRVMASGLRKLGYDLERGYHHHDKPTDATILRTCEQFGLSGAAVELSASVNFLRNRLKKMRQANPDIPPLSHFRKLATSREEILLGLVNEEKSIDEITQIMGIKLSSVRSQISRLRRDGKLPKPIQQRNPVGKGVTKTLAWYQMGLPDYVTAKLAGVPLSTISSRLAQMRRNKQISARPAKHSNRVFCRLWNSDREIDQIIADYPIPMTAEGVQLFADYLRDEGYPVRDRSATTESLVVLPVRCPQCEGEKIYRDGYTRAGTRRYECRDCQNKFVLNRPEDAAMRMVANGVAIAVIAYYLDADEDFVNTAVAAAKEGQ